MRKVVVFMLLAFLANAQPRSLSSITCEVPCKPDEFKSDPLVVLCGGGRCTTTVTLRKGKTLNMISLPAGTKGVELRMEANDDMDIKLQDADGTCIAGAECTGSSFEAVEGCSNTEDYCLPYQGMSWYFSGDQQEDPVVETLRLSPTGNVTVPLEVKVQAASASQAQVSATNGPFDSCPDQLPGCRSCSEYSGCSLIETPMCDGSATVVCSAPTTTSSTGTTWTTTSTTLSTTTFTSTSHTITSTVTTTETTTSVSSTTRSSTVSTSSTSLTSTDTTITRSITSTTSTTRSSTSITSSTTSLTSQTVSSTSTAETGTSSTITSSTKSFTTTTSTSLTETSTTSRTFTNTLTSTTTWTESTTSMTSITSSITTSMSSTTTETTKTYTSTTTFTSTISTQTTTSITRSSTRTSVTTSTTTTETSVTVTSSLTKTSTESSTSTSATSSSSTMSSTSKTLTTTITSVTSTTLTETVSTTSRSSTTSSTTETSTSFTSTSTSSSVTSTVTCGCCSHCQGWAALLGCGSSAVCEGRLEDCQAALLTSQGNLEGYKIGLEECQKREAVLQATIASLTSQLNSQSNCTSYDSVAAAVNLDDAGGDGAAVWVLIVLVLLLFLVLLLLLLCCWRLRRKYQAAKEQLMHLQDELFSRPQPAKQDTDRPDLQKQIRKLQRELDDANKKLAAQASSELKLRQMEEQLGQEQVNTQTGQELWKINRSMYSILRQVVEDSREFAQNVRDDAGKAPVFKQRIEQFEAKLAITSGRREAAEAELAQLKTEASAPRAPDEVDTTCDSESPTSITTGRRVKSKDSKVPLPSSPPGEVPLESPRLVVEVEESLPPDPPKVESPLSSFTAVAPTAPAPSSTASGLAFAPSQRVQRNLNRQESRIEEVLAQRLEISPGSLRDGIRQVGQKAKERSMVLERVLSKRLDEAKVQPNTSNEVPMEPMTSKSSQQ